MRVPVLSPNDVLDHGIAFLHIKDAKKLSKASQEREFHAHYGSSSLTLAAQWYDMQRYTPLIWEDENLELDAKEKLSGLKKFLMAHYFLWVYPKNARVFANAFKVSEFQCRGRPLWIWLMRVASLNAKVIKWHRRLDDAEMEIFIATVDGVDKKTHEFKHDTLPRDNGNCSKKHNHCGVKYQLAIAVHMAKLVHIYGPERGGKQDKTLLEESGLLDKVKDGKHLIVDRGYIKLSNLKKLSWPNEHDDKQTNNFKSRARLRHETFNGRMSFFESMSNEWSHTKEQHKIAFYAVATTIQYQMDNGAPIFDV